MWLVICAVAVALPALPQRMLALMDSTSSPCQDFYQFACGGLTRDESQREPISWAQRRRETLQQLEHIVETAKPFVSFQSCCKEAFLSNRTDLSSIQVFEQSVFRQIQSVSSNNSVELFWRIEASLLQSLPIGVFGRIVLSSLWIELVFRPEIFVRHESDLVEIYKSHGDVLDVVEKDLEQVLALQRLFIAAVKHNLSNTITSFSPVSAIETFPELASVLYPLNASSNSAAYVGITNVPLIHHVNLILRDFDPQVILTYWKLSAFKNFQSYLKNILPTQSDCSQVSFLRKLFPIELWNEYKSEVFDSKRDLVKSSKKMYHFIKAATLDVIQHSLWMDASTRSHALDKVLRMDMFVGQPIVSSSSLNRECDSSFSMFLVEKMISNSKDQYAFAMSEHSRSEFPSEDFLSVNAQYLPGLNSLLVYSGAVGSPMLEKNGSVAFNYGALGSVIGHEMSHAFDTRGRLFDAQGRARNWWSKSSQDVFLAKAQCLQNSYSDLTVGGKPINGNKTVNENLADNSGLFRKFPRSRTVFIGYSCIQGFQALRVSTWTRPRVHS
jgi:hypothetical protein